MNGPDDSTPYGANGGGQGGMDVEKVREDFPALHQMVHGRPLVYLDNAASAQKPRLVLDTLQHYYSKAYSNVHRGVHYLSEQATQAYELAREKVRAFINAGDRREIVFVRGTTEAINLVAQSYARPGFNVGDEILITTMEHHSNIVPWQMLCEQTGAVLKVAPIDDDGELPLEAFGQCLGPRTRLVAVTHLSNALGTITPVERIIEMAHAHGARVLVDGAQAAPHLGVDVQALDCDFYAFSGHKLYGPTGIGVLFAKAELLEAMPPYQGGGEMISEVTFEKTTYAGIPLKFEAGTPHFVGAIGMGAAIDYVNGIGLDTIAQHERALTAYGTQLLGGIPGLRIIGTAQHKGGILSFVLEGIHAHDLGTVLDQAGVAVRTGHHCAMPVMERFGVPATTRASLALYNTRQELDRLAAAIHEARKIFRL